MAALGFEEEEWWGGIAGAIGEEDEPEELQGEVFLVLNEVNLDSVATARRMIDEIRYRT